MADIADDVMALCPELIKKTPVFEGISGAAPPRYGCNIRESRVCPDSCLPDDSLRIHCTSCRDYLTKYGQEQKQISGGVML